MTRFFRLLLLPVVFICCSGTAFSQAIWSSEYLPSDNEDELSICTAGMTYAASVFLIRFSGESVDFFLYHNDLSLPVNQKLGSAVFSFAQNDYRLNASSELISNTSDGRPVCWVSFFADLDQTVDIVLDMKYGLKFDIFFPDGSGYVVELGGSSRAIDEALSRWENRPTGRAGRNPFGVGSGKRNPFQMQ